MPEVFLAASLLVALARGRHVNSHRTQEKPLVPRTLCPLSPLCALVNPCDPCVDLASPCVHYVPWFPPVTEENALCCPMLWLLPYVTPCYPRSIVLPLLPCITLVTLCYPVLPLLPFVPPCYTVLPHVTLVTLSYLRYPVLPLLPHVILVTLCHPVLPLLRCATPC